MTADVDMNESKQARRHDELIAELLDSRIPKTEREHAAAREIEALRTEAEQHLRQAMSNGAKARAAQAQANNLRTEVERLQAEVERWKRVNAEQVKLHVKAEIRAERLAEVLETCLEMEERPKVIELAKAALDALSKEEGK